jgi:hypothetical protein
MYLTDEILDKLNARERERERERERDSILEDDTGEKITLPDIMVCSFAKVKGLVGVLCFHRE